MFGSINFAELIFADLYGTSGGVVPPPVDPPVDPPIDTPWTPIEPNPNCNWKNEQSC